MLYVADAESNIIRAIDLPPTNEVRTLVGGDLFEFGDVDGKGDNVRLQHPLGVAVHDGRIVIADTYNHKIKLLDPAKRKVWTLAGTGTPGHRDGSGRKAQFYEPGGVAVVRGCDIRGGHKQPRRPRGRCQDGGDADGGGEVKSTTDYRLQTTDTSRVSRRL